jgi:hypothetical protein
MCAMAQVAVIRRGGVTRHRVRWHRQVEGWLGRMGG